MPDSISSAAGQAPRGGWRGLVWAGWQLLLAAALLYGVATCVYLLARVTVGERVTLVAFANNFVPWWALGGAFAALIAVIGRRWLVLAAQVPILTVFVLLYGALLLPRTTSAETAEGPAVTVATYNLLSRSSDPAAVTDVIASLDADLVGVQELGPAHVNYFETHLAAAYPYRVLHPMLPVHGVGLLSRYPILDSDVFMLRRSSMLYLRAVVEIEGVPVTVYVVHPPPPRNAFSPLNYDTRLRAAEIDALLNDHLRGETGPLIVVGDFNMSDQSDAYRAVDALLDDAFREAGRGMGFTFPEVAITRWELLPRLVRIDYIWHNADLVARDAYPAAHGGGSDHRPVIARLALRTE